MILASSVAISGGSFNAAERDGTTDVFTAEVNTAIDTDTEVTATLTNATFSDTPGDYPVTIRVVKGDLDSSSPRMTDDPDDLVFTNNLVRITNPVSSDAPGAAVGIELVTNVGEDVVVSRGEDIVVDLGDFEVPSSISETRVIIETTEADADGNTAFIGNPSEITVSSGGVVTLTVPSVVAGDSNDDDVFGAYTVTFKQSAGITNDTSAGVKTITITAGDGPDRELKAVVNRTISLDPDDGSAKVEVEIAGKGFKDGTNGATVFIDANNNQRYDEGDDTKLGEADIDDGAFTLTTKAISSSSYINAVDGAGNTALKSAKFTVKASINVEQDDVSLAETLTINLKDWPDSGSQITAVSLGGRDNFVVLSNEDGPDDGDGRDASDDPNVVDADQGDDVIEIKVPANTRTGTQTVEVWTDEGVEYEVGTNGEITSRVGPSSSAKAAASDSVAVNRLDLTVSPASAVPGESITIQGGGFGREEEITHVSVGAESNEADFTVGTEASSSGRIVITVRVPSPKTAGVGDGDKTVLVRGKSGREGAATLNVLEPTITVTPPESRLGSLVQVSGTGFPAGDLVQVLYGEDESIVDAGASDAAGNVSLEFRVPADAAIGKAHPIKVVSVGQYAAVEAEGTHSTPGAVVSVTPAEAVPGDYVTINGENMSPSVGVSEISIDGVSVLPVPRPITSLEGGFEVEVLVPLRGLGDKRVSVTVDDTTTTTFIKLIEAAAVSAPADLLAPLGARLVRVWYLDSATQAWSYYDPNPAFAPFNSLTEVSSGQVVIVIISAGDPTKFQGMTLYQGTNNIALD